MLADEYITSAKGWEQFEHSDNEDSAQQALDFSHKVAKTFNSTEGKEVLAVLVQRFLLNDIVLPSDTQMGVGIKQGQASVVKQILAHIEISNDSK